ncbi:MAG TPA: Rap1a/Tai family immunity protein [Burkholderiales bacterium]|nr:Rap1a/Tai family immunity protein [Burkholderiales bacterium]
MLLALLALVTPAQAENFLTGQRLYEMLVDQDPFLRAQASGYIAGIADANNGLGPTKLNWCFAVPNGASAKEAQATVLRYLDQNPSKRALGASGLVEEALSKRYPCKK